MPLNRLEATQPGTESTMDPQFRPPYNQLPATGCRCDCSHHCLPWCRTLDPEAEALSLLHLTAAWHSCDTPQTTWAQCMYTVPVSVTCPKCGPASVGSSSYSKISGRESLGDEVIAQRVFSWPLSLPEIKNPDLYHFRWCTYADILGFFIHAYISGENIFNFLKFFFIYLW